MKRRSRAGPVKPRRRKPAASKRASGVEAARTRSSSAAAGGESEIARLAHDLNDALERETAASEILNIISSAQAATVQPVLDTVVMNAGRLCRAFNATIYLREGESVVVQAQHGPPGLTPPIGTRRPINRDWVTGAAVLDARTIHVSDLANSKNYRDSRELAQRLGHRTTLAVPLMRDKAAIGVILATRREVHPFSKTQIGLLQNFASQSVIAIENARLLNELRQRTADLSESLEQQTATSEILKVISSSPGEPQSVFQTILANATQLCEAKFGVIFYYTDGTFHPAAELNTPKAYSEFIRQRGSFLPAAGSTFEDLVRIKQVINLTDAAQGPFSSNAAAKFGGARSQVSVPMLKEDELIGAIAIYRQQVRPFTDKQIELVKNFAAQAVVAIENARLLSELRESLERQTATSDVLRVISSSSGELKPVFDTILENATRICGAKFGILCSYDGNMFKYAAAWNAPAAFLEFMLERGPFAPRAGTPLDRILKTKDAIHRADASVDEVLTDSVRLAGARSHLTVPMFKDEAIAGAIIIYRQEVRPFSEKQLALVQNFAAQAVIAIENARLLNELRQRTTDLSESLEQQTASSEVLRVISSAPGELNAVFEAILSNATRICEATYGNLLLRENGAFRRAAQCNAPQELIDEFQKNPVFVPLPNNPLDRLLKTKDTVHTVDAQADSNLGVLADARTLLNVPMLSHDELIGAISIYRREVRPFSDKQIALLQNFAAQAVIAIDNARLLNELRDRTQEVVKLNQQLEQRVADQVGEIERMGRLRRFLPPQVADLIVASGAEKQLESHRREITALFCDLRGFTGFSESSDPEDVMALLAEYHGAIGKIIIKYSGTLERYAGDGVMVIFNDPVPVENPALQAVLMALDMRAAIGELIERWRDLGHDLGFGIGIAHGFATLGTIGFEGRRDYAAIGTVSNIASRLCDEAKPGQILISPRVRQAVEKAVTIEQIGEFSLKGIRRPMLAYNVLAVSASKSNSESN